MDNLQRLLLRFVLVPVGYAVAVVVGTLVIVFGSWKLGDAAAHAETQVFAIFGFVFAAPVLLVMLLSLMWTRRDRDSHFRGLCYPLFHISRRQRGGVGAHRLEPVRLHR